MPRFRDQVWSRLMGRLLFFVVAPRHGMRMTQQMSAESATLAWDDLAKRLERFIETWEGGREPTLAEFLPADPPSHRRLVLIELVKVDLEQRTTRGAKKPLEDYTAAFPELLE